MRFLLGVADLARWPFERFAWLLERRLVWPLRERTAGWDRAGRRAGAAVLGALAVAAIAVAAFGRSDADDPPEQVATPTRVALATPPPQTEQPKGPALQGTPPTFRVGDGVQVTKEPSGGGDSASGATSPASGTSAEVSLPDGAAAASSSSAKPVPAGPEAMKVARRFSEAFVFYEVGERPAQAKTVFGETATPQLATALSERPPRLPQDAKVPKARVLNLVAGPRNGKAYTVSVSLLRVGLTSELRLEMKKSDGTWQITDVRG